MDKFQSVVESGDTKNQSHSHVDEVGGGKL